MCHLSMEYLYIFTWVVILHVFFFNMCCFYTNNKQQVRSENPSFPFPPRKKCQKIILIDATVASIIEIHHIILSIWLLNSLQDTSEFIYAILSDTD